MNTLAVFMLFQLLQDFVMCRLLYMQIS